MSVTIVTQVEQCDDQYEQWSTDQMVTNFVDLKPSHEPTTLSIVKWNTFDIFNIANLVSTHVVLYVKTNI